MANTVDFDILAQKTVEAANGDPNSALDNLYGQTFALPTWHFIASGDLPNVNPYVASTEGFADGKPMIRAFTDLDRLQRFVREHNLDNAAGGHMVLGIPTEEIVPYLESFIPLGVHGIWFNSDHQSYGYFVPLDQLRVIKEHLTKTNWKPL